VDGHELPIQASVGIVEQPVAGVTPTELMRAAGISLRWAKADRRHRWAVFDDRRNHGQVALHRLSSAMPAALARDEFHLVYQPLVELASGRVVGVEALARWDHPEQGAVPPAQFIALAEDTGLIIPLGLRLLERACRQAQAWHREALDAPYVSVNVSARQIHHVGLVADVAAILDRTGLPPERLHLEITEGTAFADDEDTLVTLRALAGLGITLAVDDFGTGYANHAILPMLPVRTLKIANAFVRRVDDTGAGARHRAVLANLVALGRALGLRIIAEGIETLEQADYLTSIGCDIGQGWHFGHPTPPTHLAGLLASRRVR
jgi:EAL domain-containing protein (putative c-di-GMP-specific phosphodiesterase class I)